MKTGVSFFNIHVAALTRALLAVGAHPILSLSVVWVAVLALRIVLVTREASVPWNLMREAHLELALAAADVRIWIFILLVDLPAVTGTV